MASENSEVRNGECLASSKNESVEVDITNLSEEMSDFDQELYDALFEAGYPIEEIKEIIASRPLDQSVDPDLESTNETINAEELHEVDENENATDILRKMRIKNINRIIVGSLNINSFSSKFEQFKEVIGKNIDIFTIQETKLDSSFPTQQFLIDGYSEPYRLDRNREGGGVLIYVREDIPSRCLIKHNFTEYVEGLFIEINLRKTKLLFFGGYRSDHPEYGLSKVEFLEQIRFGLDKYCGYEKILVAGDFNIDSDEEVLEDFLFEQNLKNLVKEPTCYKSIDNPSTIDLFLTNTAPSFQSTTTVETGLSDFH